MTITICESSDYTELHDLLPYTQNPRVPLAQDQPERLEDLKESIVHNGLFRPMLVFGRRDSKQFDYGTILGGNQRYDALKELVAAGSTTVLEDGTKMGTQVPVTLFSGSDENAHRVVLRDNRESGDWDYIALAEFFEQRINEDIIALTGFETDEVLEIKELYLEGAFEEGYEEYQSQFGVDDSDDSDEQYDVMFYVTADQNELLESCFATLDGISLDTMNNLSDRANRLEFICAFYLQQGD